MKIIKYMMQVLVVGSLLTSCVEDADVTAYLTEDQLSNVAQDDPDKTFSAAVAGMYSDMQKYYDTDIQHNYFGQKSFDYLTSLMGNDMIMTGRFGMSLYHYLLDYWQQNYTPTNNRWKEYYRVIANANNILKLIDPSSEDPANLKYRAIALGFSGYAYLQLTYLYQHSYYTGADGTKWGRGEKYDFSQSPCVPLITEETEGDQPRATVAQIYEQIMSDLTTAFSFFKPLDMVHTSSPTDMDGCVVAMHLARANMVIHEWDKAIEYAQVVIDNIPMLTNENQILQGFSNISLPDVVFGCDITADNSTIYASYFSQMDAYSEGYAGIGVWRAAFKPFVDRIADNDIRLQWFCCDRSTGVDTEDKANGYWYTKSGLFWSADYVVGVAGYTVTLTNTTDKLMAIKWSQSSITLGSTTGLPFLDGMRYRFAGNPSATPDAIVPPHQSVKVNVYIPSSYYQDGWQQGFVGLKADGSLKGVLYIKVVDEDGKESYTTANSPNIILPPNAFSLTKVTAG